jgi:hypothetical protein
LRERVGSEFFTSTAIRIFRNGQRFDKLPVFKKEPYVQQRTVIPQQGFFCGEKQNICHIFAADVVNTKTINGNTMDQMEALPQYSLSDLAKYFLQLGTTGFGGPVALLGYMHRYLVETRKWMAADEYKEGLALSQLAPR